MPSYRYRARDERGHIVTGTMAAPTEELLAEQLKRIGYLVTGTRALPDGHSVRFVWHVLRWVSTEDLLLFNIQLSRMVRVGIPLVTALMTLELQTDNRVLRHALGDVARNVEAGLSLSEALERHPGIFSRLYISMVRAGETSGKLNDILVQLAEFSERRADLHEQLKTAAAYPALLLVVGMLVIGFLVTGIIPKFMTIFLDAGVPLPLPTRLLYHAGLVLRHAWLWLVLGAVAAVMVGWRLVRMASIRRKLDAILLRLPVIGGLAKQIALARFARTFQALASSGVPILETLEIVEQTTGNDVIARVVHEMQTNVRQGGNLSDALRRSAVFPPMVVQMVTTGELSGTLDDMLGQIADHYDVLVRYGIKRTTAFIEPCFLLIMGGMVALIMASVLLPLFRLIQVVHS